MQIDILSDCIKKIIVDYEKVEVPGLGIFSAELLPANISDDRMIVNPPRRMVTFRRISSPLGGEMLLNVLADNVRGTSAQIEKELSACVKSILGELSYSGSVQIPTFGRLVMLPRGAIGFEQDATLDLTLEGSAWQPLDIAAAGGRRLKISS